MARKKITKDEFIDLIRPHQRALLDIARQHGVALVVGFDTSSLTGQMTWTTTMFADGPICPPVSVAMSAMSDGTDTDMIEICDLILSGADISDVDAVCSPKIGRA